MKRRIVIIGLDGVPYELIKELSEKGVMPSTREIIEGGIFKKMRSCLPEVSCVAWSSIITGKNPAEHGIFGYTDLAANSYELRFSNFCDLKAIPFWELLPSRSVIINVPATYPVRKINGVHISGFVSVDIKKSVYPPLVFWLGFKDTLADNTRSFKGKGGLLSDAQEVSNIS
ncbi:MAG: alkaline phosphatase family protein [Candidatus Omnitrophica bacterium]|nr:alkaline phosphatase family protein [Candidatus Omnitrophota bacterium]MCM8770650.1 alkaline phosphatase family protein [Candidatus Omnitrophota bacterium]